ncbi:hypothetical protein [Rugosimonospora acidiphila]|uniref:hypothetical protein n=1 Tax=Rugosimonospora acidiphila TaxID=556531 RepID=UPI0031F10AEF
MPEPGGSSSAGPAPAESPEAEPSPTGPPPAGRGGSVGTNVGGQPPSDEDTPTGHLVADLVVDGSQVAVSLVGVAGDRPDRAYGWRSGGQAPPAAALPVVLGDRDGRRLHLDLGCCPDVFTVTGALPDCEKYALRLIRQVLAGGHGVAVVGDGLFGDTLPAGCRRVASMADVGGLDSPGIVVCGRLTGPDADAARLSRASGGPTPVIIGEVARSRWALRVNPT